MTNSPNWHYLLAALIRHRTPEMLLSALTNLSGNNNSAENTPDSHFSAWQGRLERRGFDLHGKRILEIGSGRYARVALWMLASGAEHVTLIDPNAQGLAVPRHWSLLSRDLLKLGLNADDAFARIEIISSDISSLPSPSPDERVDIVLSNAVLEHVQDPGQVLGQSFNWLKPAGVSCHVVDLRDHNLGFQYPFEMLTYSADCWRNWLNSPGEFNQNRWRVPDYTWAMEAAGFEEVDYEVIMQDSETLKALTPRMDAEFRSLPSEIACILSIWLIGRKPA